jgi:hypothetical protein
VYYCTNCRITWCVKKFGEWYQKTNKTEDTNKLTLLAFKIITILRLQAPDQRSEVGGLLSVSRLKKIMKGARFADVAAI